MKSLSFSGLADLQACEKKSTEKWLKIEEIVV